MALKREVYIIPYVQGLGIMYIFRIDFSKKYAFNVKKKLNDVRSETCTDFFTCRFYQNGYYRGNVSVFFFIIVYLVSSYLMENLLKKRP